MDWLAILGSLVGILTFVFSAFHYVVLKPLKETIIDLRALIDKIQSNMETEIAKRHEHDLKINTLEQKLEALSERYDSFAKYYLGLKSEFDIH